MLKFIKVMCFKPNLSLFGFIMILLSISMAIIYNSWVLAICILIFAALVEGLIETLYPEGLK